MRPHASLRQARIPRLQSVVIGSAAAEGSSDDFTVPDNGGVPVAAPGQTLVISTTLAGEPPFAHQWLRNGQAIPGATGVGDSPVLQLITPVLTSADSGVRYSVVVASAAGSVRSPEVVILLGE